MRNEISTEEDHNNIGHHDSDGSPCVGTGDSVLLISGLSAVRWSAAVAEEVWWDLGTLTSSKLEVPLRLNLLCCKPDKYDGLFYFVQQFNCQNWQGGLLLCPDSEYQQYTMLPPTSKQQAEQLSSGCLYNTFHTERAYHGIIGSQRRQAASSIVSQCISPS